MTQKFLYTPTVHDLPKTADVIVIGGGPAGAGVVWALERLVPGIHTVLIETKDQLASGSSLASLENFRTCWNAPCLATQMRRSVDIFLNADEYLGEGSQEALSVRQRGYLFLRPRRETGGFLPPRSGAPSQHRANPYRIP